MNMNKVAAEIAKREGKKKSLSIAQIKEVLGIVSDMCFENTAFVRELICLGWRRYWHPPKAKKRIK